MSLPRVTRRQALVAAGSVAAVIAAKLILMALGSAHVYKFSTPLPAVTLGAITGTTYGLLAVGLVLIFRTNRIINFAHGQIGGFGAAILGVLVLRYGIPYWVSFPFAVALAAGIGMVVEAGVIRRLRSAPRLVSVVATLGFGEFILFFGAAINSTVVSGATFPQPSWLPSFRFGALSITPAYSGMLFLSPIVALALAAFLRYSSFGLALRASAANPDAARLSGIFASRMSSLGWALAGGLSAFSAILTQPTQGYIDPQIFGPGLMLRALTGAVVARMESIPAALAAGIGLGVLEELLTWNYGNSGVVEAALFVIIMIALLAQRRRFGRDVEKGSWAAVQALRPIPDALRQLWLVRNLGNITAAASLAALVVLPFLVSNASDVKLTTIMAFSIVGLSVGILTGLGGQLTLGQFGVAAVGAVIAIHFSNRTGNFFLAILYGALGSAVVSLIVGLPALRLKGLMLTVTTLSFSLAVAAWLLAQPWALSNGYEPSPPRVFGHTLSTGRSYYLFAAAILVIAFLIARNVRRSAFGRLLVAVRDNEDAARAFTVRAAVVKMQGYLLSGFLAGLGGAVLAYSFTQVVPSTFPAAASVDVVVMTVLGGVSILAGPILGALYVIGVPDFLPLDQAGLAATSLGALLVILFLPGGLGSAAATLRDLIVKAIGRARGVDVEAAYAGDADDAGDSAVDGPGGDVSLAASLARVATNGSGAVHPNGAGHGVLLEARHLTKRFGGINAVNDVSLTVRWGETLGLIGPNGAGKTTTFELLAGFTPADGGAVIFDGRDVSAFSPEMRARQGLLRSFQDAALFPTMTVTGVVELALEGVIPARFLSSVVGYSPGEKQRRLRAREIIGMMGLDRYRDKTIQELSTGTRRITEIACLMAARPTLLLLDEPSSGVAQKDTEALGRLLVDLRSQFGLTMVIIEHDIPLVMGISDRIVAMADGRVISSGTPDEVRADPVVVEAYLGGDATAIERSAGTAGPEARTPGPRRKPVGAGTGR